MKVPHLTEAEIPVDVYKRWGQGDVSKLELPRGKYWEQRNVSQWNAKTLRFSLNLLYAERQKGALLVLGGAGIGKSEIVRQFAQDVANELGRDFVDFHNYNVEDLIPDPADREGLEHIKDNFNDEKRRKQVEENLDNSYVFLDLRAGNLNPEQVTGIPDVPFGQKKGYLKFMSADWAKLITRPKFQGMVFLDEVNRSNDYIVNSLLQFALDRKVGGETLGGNVTICAAANIGDEFNVTAKLDPAFLSRFDVGVLILSKEDWIKWANNQNVKFREPEEIWGAKTDAEGQPVYKIQKGISQYIINFVASSDDTMFFGRPEDVMEGNIPLNARQLAYASMRLQQVELVYHLASDPKNPRPLPSDFTGNIYNDIAEAVSKRMPRDWTNKFVDWLIATHAFDWAEVVEKAKKGELMDKGDKKKLSEDKKWHLISFVTQETMSRFDQARKKGDLNAQNKILVELYTDLYHILAGVGADPLSAIMTSLSNNIKNNPPEGVTREQALNNWIAVSQPIAAKAKADNPEFHARFQRVMALLGKEKRGEI